MAATGVHTRRYLGYMAKVGPNEENGVIKDNCLRRNTKQKLMASL